MIILRDVKDQEQHQKLFLHFWKVRQMFKEVFVVLEATWN